MAQKGGDQKRPTLPPKENQLFKNIVVSFQTFFFICIISASLSEFDILDFLPLFSHQKFYENKQYKKGLKAAEAILKKNPDHAGRFSLSFILSRPYIFYNLNNIEGITRLPASSSL